MKKIELLVKRKMSKADILSGKSFSFFNPISLEKLDCSHYGNFEFFSDGLILTKLFSFLTRDKIIRQSFDFGSIAIDILDFCEKNGNSVYFVGGSDSDIEKFESKIRENYPKLECHGFKSGYFDNPTSVLHDVVGRKSDLLIVGMGAGLQENFVVQARALGYMGTAYTCGAFITQEAMSDKQGYYPDVINTLNLRFFYRMIKEPHTIRRYIFTYPKAIAKLILLYFRKEIGVRTI